MFTKNKCNLPVGLVDSLLIANSVNNRFSSSSRLGLYGKYEFVKVGMSKLSIFMIAKRKS